MWEVEEEEEDKKCEMVWSEIAAAVCLIQMDGIA